MTLSATLFDCSDFPTGSLHLLLNVGSLYVARLGNSGWKRNLIAKIYLPTIFLSTTVCLFYSCVKIFGRVLRVCPQNKSQFNLTIFTDKTLNWYSDNGSYLHWAYFNNTLDIRDLPVLMCRDMNDSLHIIIVHSLFHSDSFTCSSNVFVHFTEKRGEVIQFWVLSYIKQCTM